MSVATGRVESIRVAVEGGEEVKCLALGTVYVLTYVCIDMSSGMGFKRVCVG